MTTECVSDSRSSAGRVKLLAAEASFERAKMCLGLGVALVSTAEAAGQRKAISTSFKPQRPLTGLNVKALQKRTVQERVEDFVSQALLDVTAVDGDAKDPVVEISQNLAGVCETMMDLDIAHFMSAAIWKKRFVGILCQVGSSRAGAFDLAEFYANCKNDIEIIKSRLLAGGMKLDKRFLKTLPRSLSLCESQTYSDLCDIIRAKKKASDLSDATDSDIYDPSSDEEQVASGSVDGEAGDQESDAGNEGKAKVPQDSESVSCEPNSPATTVGRARGTPRQSTMKTVQKRRSKSRRGGRRRSSPKKRSAVENRLPFSVKDSRTRNAVFRSSLRCPGGVLADTGSMLDCSVAVPPDVTLDDQEGQEFFDAFLVLRDFFKDDQTYIADEDSPAVGMKTMLAASEAMAHRIEDEGFIGIDEISANIESDPSRPLTPTRFGKDNFPPIITPEEADALRETCHPNRIFSSTAVNGEAVRWQSENGTDAETPRPEPPANVSKALKVFEVDAKRLGRRCKALFEFASDVELLAVQFNEQRSFFPAHQDGTVGAIVEDTEAGTIDFLGGDGPGDLVVTRTLSGRATVALQCVEDTLESPTGGSVLLNLSAFFVALEQRAGEAYALTSTALDQFVHCIDPSCPSGENFQVWGLSGSPSEGHEIGERNTVTYRFVRVIDENELVRGKLKGRISGMTKREWSRREVGLAISNSRVFNALVRHLDARSLYTAVQETSGLSVVGKNLSKQ